MSRKDGSAEDTAAREEEAVTALVVSLPGSLSTMEAENAPAVEGLPSFATAPDPPTRKRKGSKWGAASVAAAAAAAAIPVEDEENALPTADDTTEPPAKRPHLAGPFVPPPTPTAAPVIVKRKPGRPRKNPLPEGAPGEAPDLTPRLVEVRAPRVPLSNKCRHAGCPFESRTKHLAACMKSHEENKWKHRYHFRSIEERTACESCQENLASGIWDPEDPVWNMEDKKTQLLQMKKTRESARSPVASEGDAPVEVEAPRTRRERVVFHEVHPEAPARTRRVATENVESDIVGEPLALFSSWRTQIEHVEHIKDFSDFLPNEEKTSTGFVWCEDESDPVTIPLNQAFHLQLFASQVTARSAREGEVAPKKHKEKAKEKQKSKHKDKEKHKDKDKHKDKHKHKNKDKHKSKASDGEAEIQELHEGGEEEQAEEDSDDPTATPMDLTTTATATATEPPSATEVPAFAPLPELTPATVNPMEIDQGSGVGRPPLTVVIPRMDADVLASLPSARGATGHIPHTPMPLTPAIITPTTAHNPMMPPPARVAKVVDGRPVAPPDAVFNAGGPAWAVDFCPVGSERPDEMFYSAVAVHREGLEMHVIGAPNNEASLVQIWEMGRLRQASSAIVRPRMVLGICGDYGCIYDLKWCPAGARDPEDGPGLPRLGLLAVAHGDGGFTIYAVPHPDALRRQLGVTNANEPLFVRLQPVYESVVPNSCIWRLAWRAQGNCAVIAAGCQDGAIGVYHLAPSLDVVGCKTQAILEGSREAARASGALSPELVFVMRGHPEALRGLTWCGDAEPWKLVSVSQDMNVSIWDLRQPFYPMVRNKIGRHGWCMDAVMLSNPDTLVVCGDDGAVFQMNTRGSDTRPSVHTKELHHTTVWDVTSVVDRYYLTASSDGRVILIEAPKDKLRKADQQLGGRVVSVNHYLPNGLLVMSDNGELPGAFVPTTTAHDNAVAVHRVVVAPHCTVRPAGRHQASQRWQWILTGGWAGLMRMQLVQIA